MKKKLVLTAIVALTLALCAMVGVTVAYLVDQTNEVVNTFTYGDINISISETDAVLDSGVLKKTFKMIPGNSIDKDPTITVEANSEACWLFVKITRSANFDQFMTFAIADGWTQLSGHTDVYYRKVDATVSAADFHVLKNDEVIVKSTVTKDDFNALTTDTYPKLIFMAYAVQQANIADDAAAAWAIANP